MLKKCNALKEINAGRLIEVLGSQQDNMIMESDDDKFGDSDDDSTSDLSSELHDDSFSLNSQSRVSAKNDRSVAGGQSRGSKYRGARATEVKKDKVKIEMPAKSGLD